MNKDRSYSTLSWVRYLLRNATCVAATYERRKKQVGKDFMYMMTALWMEQSPWNFKYPQNQNPVGKEKGLNVVGAVFVLPNDRVLSADCSRRNISKVASQVKGDDGIVHGAVQALIKYPDQVKDCKVYLSRKPCAHCVKMLVQAAVDKVFYLPLRPEKDAEDENKSVDALFQVSTVSRSLFVPYITDSDIDELTEDMEKPDEDPKNPYGICLQNLGEQGKNYAKEEWEKWMPNIPGQHFRQEFEGKIEEQVDEDIKIMFEWFNTATFATGYKKNMDWEVVGDKKPEDNKKIQPEVASHLSRLAQMLSNRTDDPNRGVGCVITVEDEIVSIGWNGFPSKALYGNHPRGSESDKDTKSKYPHVIHAAEQNALMCRNRRQLTDGIAYVNRPPCNECMPMLYQLGIKTFVLPEKTKQRETERYFYELLEKGETIVYRQVKPRDSQTDS